MRGAAALLAQLSPETLEGELDAERARGGGGGFAVGPWKFKALWDVLKRRHGDLASEEQERFALLFGAEFGRAYTALTKETRAAQKDGARGGKPRVKTASEPTTLPPPGAPNVGPTGTAVVAAQRDSRGPGREGPR
jgi:hypothetical protein